MADEGSCLEEEGNELCYRCRSIPATTFFSSRNPRHKHQHKFGPTQSYQLIKGSNAFEELKLSAAAGCDLCKLFQDAIRHSGLDPEEQLGKYPELEYWKDGIKLQRSIHDCLQITFCKTYHYRIDARLLIFIDESTTRSIEPPWYVVETESDSPANFALARSWLAECCKDHVACRDPGEFESPSRLLDVGIPSKAGIIRLVSAIDLQIKDRTDYAALSHCWGSFQPLQTKKDNLRSHVEGIPYTWLPQTFQDAVRTTRELGLRYLWIDSLCIVQDDLTDCEAECARMNVIFSNALCTISASDARDSTDGLFRSRTMKPIRLTYESDGFEPKLIVTIQPAFHGPWMLGLKGPLQRRAWVLQERHLSPRIIHYTKKGLMWECRTAIASEHLPKMQLKANVNSSLWHVVSSNRFLDGGRLELGPEDTRSCLGDDKFRRLHDRWYKIVQEYSSRVLSRPEDKLPALSGFAAEWKRMKPEDEYYAGLWKSDILAGLAWFPGRQKHGIRRRLPESNATWPPSTPFEGIPTWSWAAFDGPVAHFAVPGFHRKLHDHDMYSRLVGKRLLSLDPCPLRVHDVSTKIEQLNPFGHVSKGEIVASNWSIVVTLSESNSTLKNAFPIGEGPRVWRLYSDIGRLPDGAVYFDHEPLSLPKIQVRLLQLRTGIPLGKWTPCVCGLALLQLQTDEWASNKDLYRRVGMFNLDDSFWLPRREWKTVTII